MIHVSYGFTQDNYLPRYLGKYGICDAFLNDIPILFDGDLEAEAEKSNIDVYINYPILALLILYISILSTCTGHRYYV